MFRKEEELKVIHMEKCHNGEGALTFVRLFDNGRNDDMLDFKSKHGLLLMHKYILPPGVSIGEHGHRDDEEIYYLIEGECIMIMDGEHIPMGKGDISVLQSGHSHGIINSGSHDAVLLVVGAKKELYEEV
ncbi:MAG: cupin domain-containing protein [Bacillota bacterium]|nr:cupin domain-containing protein [Bacillota bacterium]